MYELALYLKDHAGEHASKLMALLAILMDAPGITMRGLKAVCPLSDSEVEDYIEYLSSHSYVEVDKYDKVLTDGLELLMARAEHYTNIEVLD